MCIFSGHFNHACKDKQKHMALRYSLAQSTPFFEEVVKFLKITN